MRRNPFVIGQLGSSAAAGQGNFFNETYAAVFEREMAPIFKAMHAPLAVRNHAIIGTGTRDWALCIGNVVGDDVDAVWWEADMTDAGDRQREIRLTIRETFYRRAMALPNQPNVYFLHVGYPREPKEGKPVERQTDYPSYAAHGLSRISPSVGRRWHSAGVHFGAMARPLHNFDHLEKFQNYHSAWHPNARGHAYNAVLLQWHYLEIARIAATYVRQLKLAVSQRHGTRLPLDQWLGTTLRRALPRADSIACTQKPFVCDDVPLCHFCPLPHVGPGVWDLMVNETNADGSDGDGGGGMSGDMFDRWHTVFTSRDKLSGQAGGCEPKVEAKLKSAWLGIGANHKAGWMKLRVNVRRRGRIYVCQPPYCWGPSKDTVLSVRELEYRVDGGDVLLPLSKEMCNFMTDTDCMDDPTTRERCRIVTRNATVGEHVVEVRVPMEGKRTVVGSIVTM